MALLLRLIRRARSIQFKELLTSSLEGHVSDLFLARGNKNTYFRRSICHCSHGSITSVSVTEPDIKVVAHLWLAMAAKEAITITLGSEDLRSSGRKPTEVK